MAFVDDYAIISGTNFNCEATGSWSTTGSVPTVTLTATNADPVQGTNAIEITASGAGVAVIFNDTATGLRLDQEDVHFWFKYAKGKSPPYLTSTNTAVRVRLHVGTVGNYYEYWLTDFGDEELVNGYQVFQFSGSNSNATGGTPVVTNNVVRVELRLDFANANNGGDDNPLVMDAWFAGTKIGIEEGNATTPATLADLQNYSDTRSAFPLGLVSASGGFLNLRCGLDIGGTLAGYLELFSQFVLVNQFSNEVKHPITIKSNGTLIAGELDGGRPVRGCQFVLPANRLSDLSVENGGTLRLFGSKLFRFRDILLGAASDTSSTVELDAVDIGSCETVYPRANTLDIKNSQIHDNDNNNRDWAAEISVSPDSCENLLIYSNVLGAKFTSTLTINGALFQDNTNDFTVLDPATVTLRNSNYDPAKVSRVTS